MPKVSLELGLTIPRPENQFANVKPSIRFSDIDTEGDVDEQIKVCVDVASKAVSSVEEALVQEASNLMDINFEGIGIASVFESFEKWARQNFDHIIKEMTRQKGIVDALNPNKEAVVSEARQEKKKDV